MLSMRLDGLLRFARNDGSTPELSLLFEIRVPSLRGAKRRSNPCSLCGEMDCFASLAMTAQRLNCLCCLKLECRHFEIRVPSLRGAKRRSNPSFLCGLMDCFAEPAIRDPRVRPRLSGACTTMQEHRAAPHPGHETLHF